MAFGQVVVGPPGSGKTTYCNGMSQFLSLIGRKVAVINLDPANDSLPYECAVNIEELVKLNDVMVEHSLGPNGGKLVPFLCLSYLFIFEKLAFLLSWNHGGYRTAETESVTQAGGFQYYTVYVYDKKFNELLSMQINDSCKRGHECATPAFIRYLWLNVYIFRSFSCLVQAGLVYCMDYLEKNIDWLQAKLEPLLKDHYLLFDFPGQVELFFLHSNAKNVIMKLIKKLDLRLAAVHLIDSHLCSDPGKYISALLLSLSTMLHLELPHINVLSKIDLIESYGRLHFNLDFYTDVLDLEYLQYVLDQDPRSAKYSKMTKELCDVIEQFGIVNFTTLDIQDKESVGKLVKLIDKTNGYIFAGIEASAVEFSKIAVGPVDWDYYRVAEVQEKYMKDDDDIDDNE